jgi:hypothetical protein
LYWLWDSSKVLEVFPTLNRQWLCFDLVLSKVSDFLDDGSSSRCNTGNEKGPEDLNKKVHRPPVFLLVPG